MLLIQNSPHPLQTALACLLFLFQLTHLPLKASLNIVSLQMTRRSMSSGYSRECSRRKERRCRSSSGYRRHRSTSDQGHVTKRFVRHRSSSARTHESRSNHRSSGRTHESRSKQRSESPAPKSQERRRNSSRHHKKTGSSSRRNGDTKKPGSSSRRNGEDKSRKKRRRSSRRHGTFVILLLLLKFCYY